MSRILFADDDPTLTEALTQWLNAQTFTTYIDVCSNGDDAWNYLRSSMYDLVILDWEMPGLQGVEIIQRYRNSGGLTPILMLTGKESVEDKEAGLDAGADDYLTKPFNLRELAARLRALLRRPAQIAGDCLSFRHIVLDRAKRQATANGTIVPLQPMEFEVLEFFLLHPHDVFTIESLLARLWDNAGDISTQALYSAIKRLRKKLDMEGQASIFQNIYGKGYALNQS